MKDNKNRQSLCKRCLKSNYNNVSEYHKSLGFIGYCIINGGLYDEPIIGCDEFSPDFSVLSIELKTKEAITLKDIIYQARGELRNCDVSEDDSEIVDKLTDAYILLDNKIKGLESNGELHENTE